MTRRLEDAFVRARNSDGTIQLGFAASHLPYGERPVDIKTVDRHQAARLAVEIIRELAVDRKERS